jgi:hypothetical protein
MLPDTENPRAVPADDDDQARAVAQARAGRRRRLAGINAVRVLLVVAVLGSW